MIDVGSFKSNCLKNSCNPSSTLSILTSVGSDMYLISDLLKIRKYLPIIYTGHREIVVAKLIVLVAGLRKKHDINYFLVVKNEFRRSFPYNFVVSKEDFDVASRSLPKVCVCKELEGGDTVFQFAKENKIDLFVKNSDSEQKGGVYFYGTPQDYKEATKKFSSNLLRNAVITDSLVDCADKAKVVIGKESAGLVACGYLGKIIRIIPEGTINSFQMMFPDSKLLE
jgi:aspartokinase